MPDQTGQETPDWFWEAIDIKPVSGFVEVQDADIHYLGWSGTGNPGLLFVHGHNAHAHWWDFIAPSFRETHQVVALDLSGMGDSDHREAYSTDLYAEEIIAVMDACEMSQDTVIVAHSFGGIMALRAAARNPTRMKGLVLLDSGVRHPEEERPREPERWSRPKVYPDLETARSRFRLQPPQRCDNEYLVRHIARNSIEHIDEGFVWKFDEELGTRMTPAGDTEEDLRTVEVRLALVYGEISESFSARSAEYMKSLQPALEVHELGNARHHLFLDQPLDFMDRLSRILSDWA